MEHLLATRGAPRLSALVLCGLVLGACGERRAPVAGEPASRPAKVEARRLAVADREVCALDDAGAVRCWRRDEASGRATALGSFGPAERLDLPLAARDLAAIDDGVCALLADATVSCWTTGSPPQPLAGVAEVRSLDGRAFVNEQGTVVEADLDVVRGVAGATRVRATGNFGCALTAAGAVACWGSMVPGQRYDPGADERLAHEVAGLTGVVDLAVGDWHLCALLRDGQVRCVGANYAGQLGDGRSEDSTAPIAPQGLARATALASRYIHTCALLADGGVACWGAQDCDACADGPEVGSVPRVIAGVTGAVEVAVGLYYGCARCGDGAVRCFGPVGEDQYSGPAETRVVELR